MTVFDNVRAAVHLHRSPRHPRCALARPRFSRSRSRGSRNRSWTCSKFLTSAAFAKPRLEISPYGDQRRLEIVRALATQPKLLLLDEPAAGMNPSEKAEFSRLIRLIKDRFKIVSVAGRTRYAGRDGYLRTYRRARLRRQNRRRHSRRSPEKSKSH